MTQDWPVQVIEIVSPYRIVRWEDGYLYIRSLRVSRNSWVYDYLKIAGACDFCLISGEGRKSDILIPYKGRDPHQEIYWFLDWLESQLKEDLFVEMRVERTDNKVPDLIHHLGTTEIDGRLVGLVQLCGKYTEAARDLELLSPERYKQVINPPIHLFRERIEGDRILSIPLGENARETKNAFMIDLINRVHGLSIPLRTAA